MRYLTFSVSNDPTPALGVLNDEAVIGIRPLVLDQWQGRFPETLLDLIRSGPAAWRHMETLIKAALAQNRVASQTRYSPEQIRWHAPIPRPAKNIVCLGLNYRSHVVETSRPLQRDG